MLVWYLAMRTYCLKASSVCGSCEAGLSVVEVRRYQSWSRETHAFAFFPYRLRAYERAEKASVSTSFCTSNVASERFFPTCSRSFVQLTRFLFDFNCSCYGTSSVHVLLGHFHRTSQCSATREGTRDVTSPIDH